MPRETQSPWAEFIGRPHAEPATEAGGRGAGAGNVTGAGAPSEAAAPEWLLVHPGILVAEPYICTKCREL